MATMLGLEPLMGLIAGSITLSGGHGTGAAQAQTFTESFGLEHTMEIAMAAATFGLVMGGIIGSPVGKRLISRNVYLKHIVIRSQSSRMLLPLLKQK